MNEEEKKQLAFLYGIVVKMLSNSEITNSEMIQIQNVADDLGYEDLAPDEFRW